MQKTNIRLSQCMIVKNEEANIKRALSWAKDIAFEQIVVDTGSTDRTVEIAEEMGAKVYHFTWVDDFSAAKNFALEQASGDWIAFLDADEYFKKEDLQYLSIYIQTISEVNKSLSEKDKVYVLQLPCLHLDDEGKVFAVGVQERIFQNCPWLRYKNKIHEQLYSTSDRFLCTNYPGDERLPIYHTGYAQQIIKKEKKVERNINMLKTEININPNSGTLWSYLGDAYFAGHQLDKAEECWIKALELKDPDIDINKKMKAVSSLLYLYIDKPEKSNDFEKLYQEYRTETHGRADIDYWMGCFCILHDRYSEAVIHLKEVINFLINEQDTNSYYCTGRLVQIYEMLMQANNMIGNKPEVVHYAVQCLQGNKKQEHVLATLLQLFKETNEQIEGVVGFLMKLYDFGDLRDILFIIKCAQVSKYQGLIDFISAQIPEDIKQQFGLTDI